MNKRSQELQIGALEHGTAHLIEANAGTGKTYAIANLFLRFVLEGTPVQKILVVTFTRAATDELRGRIRKRLNDARIMLTQGQVDEKEDDFFRGLLDKYSHDQRDQPMQHLALALLDINEAPIYTIHGFCQQALTDQAFSSSQAFELEQVDDTELKLNAMRDWWRKRTYDLTDDALGIFYEIIPSYEKFREQLDPLLKTPSPELYPHPTEDLEEVERQLVDQLKVLAGLWKAQGKEVSELLLTHKAMSRTNKNGQKPAELEPVLDELDRRLSKEQPEMPEKSLLSSIAHGHIELNKSGKNKEDFDREPFYQAKKLFDLIAEFQHLQHINELAEARDFVKQQLRIIKDRQGMLSFDDMIDRLHEALYADNSASNRLSQCLASSYPVILLDEFQDTDVLQYAIFSRIHKAKDSHTLILIGDPKQAIYGFRGGDIFTYMQASHEADHHWSLSTNWRSSAEMIEAVNTLFDGSNTFTYEDIPYSPSQAPDAGSHEVPTLSIDGNPIPALRAETLPAKEDGKPLSKDEALQHIHQAVAQQIAALLANENVLLGESRLKPADIAVLVRTSKEAAGVRSALGECGVRAISAGKDSIWKTDEAGGLRLLLEACLLPTDRTLLRQALSTSLLGLEALEIHAIATDYQRWSRWVELIHETSVLWSRRGVMPAFHSLLDGLSNALTADGQTGRQGWLDRIQDPERSLTNLLHLAELLQQASQEHAGGESLMAWMRLQQESHNQEEHELRLESDEELVKIITMHKSKGLQFPVVFAPYLWHCRPANHQHNESLKWHQQDGNAYRHYYTPWLDHSSQKLPIADHERLAEDVRLTYVALTRAESHCHFFFGPAGSANGHSGQTALAWLLSEQNIDLDQGLFTIPPASVTLQPLENRSNIEVIEPRQSENNIRISTSTLNTESLHVAQMDRNIRSNWHIGSYTAMTRNVHQAIHITSAIGNEDFALRYPAGARVGSFLHAMLEQINTVQPLKPQIERLCASLCLRHGIDPEQDTEQLANWMHNILNTSLDDKGLCIADLEQKKALHELEFDLSTHLVECDDLNTLLNRHKNTNDAKDTSALEFDSFQGMITGVIDLVFEHDGKYFIADYKSNLLGRKLDDYTSDKLANEISTRRYDVQYLIYTLAIHRHLRQRIHDYDYERDFGGAYYLFLRAMQPEHGPQYGVFFDKPDQALITALDTKIFGHVLETAA